VKSGKLIYANVIFFFVVFFLPCCKESERYKQLSPAGKNEKIFFDFKIAEVPIKIEVAATPEERAKGLMFRESMSTNEGMLFIFEEGTSQRFWMKNTRIPLDIGYLSSSGVLLEIHKAKPHDTSGVPSRSNDIKFVLELNEGAYKKLGISIGSKVSLKRVSEIIDDRGLNPSDYSL
jgi:uncharacterized membrane protein (UPF0127 family)